MRNIIKSGSGQEPKVLLEQGYRMQKGDFLRLRRRLTSFVLLPLDERRWLHGYICRYL
jgi:hypothetical protein